MSIKKNRKRTKKVSIEFYEDINALLNSINRIRILNWIELKSVHSNDFECVNLVCLKATQNCQFLVASVHYHFFLF